MAIIQYDSEDFQEILKSDDCVIGPVGCKCDVCGKPIEADQKVTFINEGIAKLFVDHDSKGNDELIFVIDNLVETSKIVVMHRKCD